MTNHLSNLSNFASSNFYIIWFVMHVHKCMYVHIYVVMYVCILYMYVHVCMYVHIYIYVCTCVYVRISYVHTYVHKNVL